MKDDVAEALNAWLPSFQLPAHPGPGVKDLKGVRVRVARFSDEETLRFFFPRRSLIFHQRIVRELTEGLRQRGAKIDTVLPNEQMYRRWLEASAGADSPEVRFRFATELPGDLAAPE